jgi:hypothetical protein
MKGKKERFSFWKKDFMAEKSVISFVTTLVPHLVFQNSKFVLDEASDCLLQLNQIIWRCQYDGR